MTDQELRLLFKIFLVSAFFAFMPIWRRLGLREQSEFDTAKPRRGLALFGIAVVLLAIGLAF